jgi:hypothetical protein
MGLKVHHDGFKPINHFEWQSAVVYVRLFKELGNQLV